MSEYNDRKRRMEKGGGMSLGEWAGLAMFVGLPVVLTAALCAFLSPHPDLTMYFAAAGAVIGAVSVALALWVHEKVTFG